MLDGLQKSRVDQLWQGLARPLARSGVSPNQVTWIGLILVLANCAGFMAHGDTLWFGIGLAFSVAFDALDGAVARLQGTESKYGGYLDAVVDRYQEIAAFFVIAWMTGWWAVCFVAITGSLLTSYNKARTAMEIPVQNHAWPDLLERFERIVLLCLGLILDSFIVLPDLMQGSVLYLSVLAIALLSHVTAIQRFFRARAMLMERD